MPLTIFSTFLSRKNGFYYRLLHGNIWLFVIISGWYCPKNLLAQDTLDSPFTFGVHLSGGINLHTTSFIGLPGIRYFAREPYTASTKFSDISGWGLGIEGSFSLTGVMRGSLRIDYQTQGALLLSNEATVFSLLLPSQVNRVPVRGIIQHSLLTSLGTLGITPMLKTNVSQGLSAAVGVRLGFLVRSGVLKTREIFLPEYPDIAISFVNSQTNQLDDTTVSSLPFALTFQPSVVAALQYAIPLNNGKYVFTPEISFQQGLRNIVEGVTWSVALVRVGFSLTLPVFHRSNKTEIQAHRTDAMNAMPVIPTTASLDRVNTDSLIIRTAVRDTVYQRDTTVRLVAWDFPQRVSLLQKTLQQDLLSGNSRLEPLVIKELYQRDIPKTRPVLLPGVEITFLRMGADKKTIEQKHAQKLSVETVQVRQYYALPYREYYDTTEVYHTVRPPSVRFYPKFISEAGIRAAKAEIFQQYRGVSRQLVQFPFYTDTQKHTDWNTSLYNSFPERYIITEHVVQPSEKQTLSLGCRLFVEDKEGQYLTTDSARIIFEQEVIAMPQNNASAEINISRQHYVLHLTNPEFLPDSLNPDHIRERNRRAYQAVIDELTPLIPRNTGKTALSDEWRCAIISSWDNTSKPSLALRGHIELIINDLCRTLGVVPVYQALPPDIEGFDAQTGKIITKHFPPPLEVGGVEQGKIPEVRIIRIVLERKLNKP